MIDKYFSAQQNDMKRYNEVELLKFFKGYITQKNSIVKNFGSVSNLNKIIAMFVKTENFNIFIKSHYNFYMAD